MIYTVTFNPALDYVVKVDNFTTGTVNRTVSEEIFYGGKGINVSAVLKELGYASTALGFVAGFTGDEIERGVRTLGFASDFIRVKDGMSRINVKMKSDNETEINGIGPQITESDVEKLFEKLGEAGKRRYSRAVRQYSRNRLTTGFMKQLCSRLDGKGIRIVVDATKELLLNVLKYHPFLIKPNNHELGEMFGAELKSDEDIITYAGKLQEMGAVNVLVSMAGDGAILVTEEKEIYKMGVAKGTVKNSVGAGDSMVAGFIAGYLDKRDYAYALKLGTASGSATAFSEGIATRKDIIELLEKL